LTEKALEELTKFGLKIIAHGYAVEPNNYRADIMGFETQTPSTK